MIHQHFEMNEYDLKLMQIVIWYTININTGLFRSNKQLCCTQNQNENACDYFCCFGLHIYLF